MNGHGNEMGLTKEQYAYMQTATGSQRMAEMERQLESARSLAVDRDQRLEEISELATRALEYGEWGLVDEIDAIASGRQDT